MKKSNIKKLYYFLVVIVLLGWLIYSVVPMESCHQERFVDKFLHWDVCDDMSFMANILFVIFDIFLTIGSVVLICWSILSLNKNI